MNSLRAWKDDLQKRHRSLAARHARMKAMPHPDANDQGILIEINKKMLGIVDAAIRCAVALENPKS